MKLGAISLVTLLALCLLYFVVNDAEDAGKELDPNRPAEVVEAKAIARDLASPALEVSAAAPLEKRTAVANSKPEESSVVNASAKIPAVQGRVILTDELGVENSNVNGELTVVCWKGNSGSHVRVEIANGEFVLDASGCEKLSINSVELGDRSAELEDSDAEYPVEGEPIVVRVHWPRILLLTVLDQLSGTHLSRVTVAGSQGWEYEDEEHPGRLTEETTLLTNGTSPIEIRPPGDEIRRADKVYFVHSPGYAWKTIHLDLTQGGQREIRLEQGGDLALHLVGELAEGGPLLRLRPSAEPDGSVYLEVPTSTESAIEITGLLPGKYNASVELGEWYDSPQSLGAVDVVVDAGIKNEYELLVTLPPTTVRARLAGTLFLPPAWGFTSFEIEADLDRGETGGLKETHTLSSSDMEQLAGDDGAWTFDYGEIPTGDYELKFSSAGYPTELEYGYRTKLESAGNEQVQFRIPQPATVVIQIFEEPGGEPAKIVNLSWDPRAPKGTYMSAYVSSEAVPGKQGYFEFQAPVGQLGLHTFGDGYTTLQEVVDVRSGRNEFTYRLSRECALVIVFLDGKTPVPIGDEWYPRPEHLDGEGKLLYTSYGGSSGFKTALSKPGRYVFEIPELEAFEPIPKQTITVRSGEETRHVVQLVRKQ